MVGGVQFSGLGLRNLKKEFSNAYLALGASYIQYKLHCCC
jgi:hypothetical protein